MQLTPEDFTIDEYYRFEGASDPADNSIVYAISANDNNLKGVLVDAYGIYAKNIIPGMAAYCESENRRRQRTFLPSDAVLRDGKMAMVWIQTSQNKFKSVMVETGTESEDMIEIKSGIQQNDEVVTSGAYLLQSEFIFRKGANPMAGMDHGGMKM